MAYLKPSNGKGNLRWLPLEFEEPLFDILSKLSDKDHGFDFQTVQNKN